MKIEFSAKTRDGQGTGASRRLRHAGLVPGILYGGNQSAQAIELNHNELYQRMKQEAFHASILTMNLDGSTLQVLLRDVQMHPHRIQIMHVDFQRVAEDQKIHMKVPLHFKNADLAPGVKLVGGIVTHILNEVDVSCLPKDLPEFIEVDLAELSAGRSIHLSEVQMPKGVEALVTKGGADPVVATCVVPRVIAEEEAAAVSAPDASAVPASAQKSAAELAESEKQGAAKPEKSEKKKA